MTSVAYRGLAVEGTVTHDPGVRYYPDGSGDPPYTEVEIESIDIEDWEEFSSWELLSKLGISEGTQRMLGIYLETSGRMLPSLERIILARWEDAISEALEERALGY